MDKNFLENIYYKNSYNKINDILDCDIFNNIFDNIFNYDNCLICLDCFEESNFTNCKNCKKKFHIECIDKWIYKSNTCPHCRKYWNISEFKISGSEQIPSYESIINLFRRIHRTSEITPVAENLPFFVDTSLLPRH